MSLKKFQLINKLGEGAFSTVYKVRRIEDGNEYALKKVKLSALSEKEKQNALNEVRILASIRDNNIIGYKEAFLDNSSCSLCIVMEYADGGDLLQRIQEHQKRGVLFDENEIWSIFIQIVKGLKALHDLNIYHRDIKSANIFLSKDGVCKLGDMNVSKVAKKGMLYTQTGTPYYASPEVWKDQAYNSKSDIWSLGCVLYELTTLKPPFKAEDMEGLYKKVVKGQYPRIPTHFSNDLANMIKLLLQVHPNLRLSCDKILQLNFVIHRIEDKYFVETDEINHDLLNTIRFPKLLNHLNERLPAANYSPLKTKQFINKKVNQKYRYKSEQEFSDENNFKNINAMIQKIEKNKEYLKSIIENRKPEKFAPLYDDDIFFIKSIGEKFKNENLEKYSENNLLHLPQIEGLKRIEDVQKKSNLRRLPKLLC